MFGLFLSDEDDVENELWSWGWTLSVSCLSDWDFGLDLDWDWDRDRNPTAMSRRSLRIDDSLLDRSLPHCAASFSAGGANAGRKNRPASSRRLSSSCSESLLLHTPRKPTPACSSSLNTSGIHSVTASDTSLISSLLDESSIQESTAIEGFWGLDSDADPKESTMLCESTIVADITVIGSDTSCLRPRSALIGRDPLCSKHSKTLCECNQLTGPPSEPSCSLVRPETGLRPGPEPEPEPNTGTEPQNPEAASTIYCRGRKQKGPHCAGAMKDPSPKYRRTNGALGDAAIRAFKWARRKWDEMNKDTKNRFPLELVLLLVLLFAILFSVLWFGLASPSESQVVQSELPLLQTAASQSDSSKPESPETESAEVGQSGPDAVLMLKDAENTENVETVTEQEPSTDEEISDLDSSRLERLEQSLSSLWKQVDEARGGDDPEPVARGDEDSDTDSALEQQLELVRTRLDQDRRLWEQVRQREKEQQQSHSLRLEQIEEQLNELSRRTLDLELKHAGAVKDFSDSAAAPLGSDVESQSVMYTELSRLQGSLQSVRQEIQSLSGCRGTCSQLQNLQATVSTLVQEQVQDLVQEQVWTMVFGSKVLSGLDSKPLVQVVSERFVSEQSLQGALSVLERRILDQVHTQDRDKEEEGEEEQPAGGAVTQQDVHKIVQTALRRFSEDRTGLADYALESGGGSIVSTRCSQSFETKAALLSLFGIPLWYYTQSPRTIIQPDVQPGNCWAFRGSSGEFVIRLSSRILPSSVSLEHIPRSLSPTGSVQSAPKEFSVYGLKDEVEEEGALLGTFTYDQDGDALQSFSVSEENDDSFQFVLVKVLSNWGHEEFTCVYRFRVHGTPTENEADGEADNDDGEADNEADNEANNDDGEADNDDGEADNDDNKADNDDGEADNDDGEADNADNKADNDDGEADGEADNDDGEADTEADNADNKADGEADGEADNDDGEADNETVGEVETQVETKTKNGEEAETDNETDGETEDEAETGPGEKTGTVTEDETGDEEEAETETKTETGEETELETETKPASEPGLDQDQDQAASQDQATSRRARTRSGPGGQSKKK